MYFLQNQVTGEYVCAMVKLRAGNYAVYYRRTMKECSRARWATLRGAEAAMARLYNSGTVPVGMLAVAAEREGDG